MKQERHFPDFLRIAVLPSSRKTIPEAIQIDGNETKYYNDVPLIRLLSEIFDFKFNLIEPEDGLYGDSLPDGNWTGMVGLVHRNEADLAISSLSLSEKRSLAVDFSHPYKFDPITFITDKPGYVPDKYAMLRPFSISVWIAVVTSLVLVLCISYLFKINNDPRLNMTLKIYGSLLEKSVNFRLHRLSINFFIFSWIMGAMFISQFYKTNLLSSLTFPALTGIQNIEQLSKASEDFSFKCSTYEGTNIFDEILSTGGDSWKKIATCLTRSNSYENDLEAFLGSYPGRKAYLGERNRLNVQRKKFFISDDAFFIDFTAIAIRKSFCCKETLNKALLNIAAVGMLEKFIRDDQFFLALRKQKLDNKEYDKNRALAFEELSGAFIILAFGHALATIVFAAEILRTRH